MPQPKGEGSIIRLEGTSKADCRLWRLRFNMDDGTRRELERFRSQLESPEQESLHAPRSPSTRPTGSSCAASRARCAPKPS